MSLQQWCIANVEWPVQLFERMDLTDKQLIQWRQLGSALSAPPALCQQALSFYSQYRQFQSWGPEGMGAVWHAAYFLAEKAQVLFDGEGKRIRSVALSGNAVLRDQTGHEDFLYHLRQMTRSVPLPKDSQQLQEEVGLFARQMSFSLTFLNKLRSTLHRIRVSQKGDSGVEYEEQVQRCLWLLFVDCRAQRALSSDILENTCLLSCILAHFLHEKYHQEGVYSIYFHQDTEGHTLPNEHEELLVFVMEYFLIKDANAHLRAHSAYQLYLQGLGKIMDIRRFFSPQNITRNIHSLQRAYSKRITDQQLDQSSFLKGNSTILHPRVTPFARRGLMTNRNIPALSHRMLNFELEQENQSQLSNQHKEEDNIGVKVLQRLKNRPTPKTGLIRATPMTEAMQMYNWLYDMRGRHTNPLLAQQTASIRHVLSLCSSDQISVTTVELIGGLWMESLEKCPLEPLPSLSLLLLSTHVALHVLNANQVDLSIPISQLQVGELQVWEGLDWLLNFDRAMPVGLRLHLLSVETSFISNRLWGSAGLVEALGEEWGKEGRHRLLKRVTHQAAMEIHFLCRKLGMGHMENAEDLSYRIFQKALKSPQKLLFERSLQQLVVCCIYAATKVLQLGTKFNEILGVCREVLGLSAASFQQLVDRVRVGDRKDSIILFYNMSFVPALKGFLRLLRDNHELTNWEGPHVRDMISVEAVLAKNQLSSPQMANYLAYSESPILRPRLKQLNQNVRHQPHSQQYSLQDIEAKFGKATNTASLKEARRTKH